MISSIRAVPLILLLFLSTIVVNAVSPYTEESHRVMLKGRDCLPLPLVEMMNGWFKRMSDMAHYRALNTVVLEQLGVSMASGKDICASMVVAQTRTLQFHKYTIAQRDASSIPMRKNDGWGETQRKLEALLPYTMEECQMYIMRHNKVERLEEAERKAKGIPPPYPPKPTPKQCIMAVVKESRKVMIVGHLNKA